MSVLLFVIVFSAGLGLVVQSTLRGQGAAVSSTPAAASKPAEHHFEAAGTAGMPADNTPATRSGPPAGYAGAGMSGMMPARMPEVWQAQQNIPYLLAKYAETADEKERAKIKEGLAKELEKLFDLQQKERESEIADIEARVKRLRDMLDKRTKARQSIISNRLDQLIREAEGLGWVEPAPAGMPASGMMPMPSGSGMYSGARSGMGGSGGGGMGYGAGMGAYGPVQATPAEVPKATPDGAKRTTGTTSKKRAVGPGAKRSTP
jgi:hypothetical protein